jgi:hypothetical protein
VRSDPGASLGFEYIAKLLGQVNKWVGAQELRGTPKKRMEAPQSTQIIAEPEEENKWKAKFEDNLERIREAEKNNDLGTAERLHGERYQLAQDIAEAQGLRGRPRKLGQTVQCSVETLYPVAARSMML